LIYTNSSFYATASYSVQIKILFFKKKKDSREVGYLSVPLWCAASFNFVQFMSTHDRIIPLNFFGGNFIARRIVLDHYNTRMLPQKIMMDERFRWDGRFARKKRTFEK